MSPSSIATSGSHVQDSKVEGTATSGAKTAETTSMQSGANSGAYDNLSVNTRGDDGTLAGTEESGEKAPVPGLRRRDGFKKFEGSGDNVPKGYEDENDGEIARKERNKVEPFN